MTREEMIEEIKRWTPILLNSGQCTEKTSEAQDMAISALTADNTMEWLEDEDGSYECSKCHITRSGLISGVFNFCPNCGRKAVSE
jgi:Zn finger protein HypA/HybF involved in hydrogenase expression